ncbi:protein mono-ADP-ribosyltransferase PARP3-like [Ptychodera flava]|uniref:protein mono-ADP-ribosyltransferase PARP3-like n=1 Tax=Ptychodera flava TaxID=63121 RepID=UPI00396A19C4
MPPKRKAAAKKAPAGGKKAKKAVEDAEPSDVKSAIEALKTADKGKKKSAKVDQYCSLKNSAQVFEDYDCMLNQTNIGHNNNKYYVIQLLKYGAIYYVWNRWGRVGEPGQNALKGPFSDIKSAQSEFEKKFKDKTRNAWGNRDNFKPSPGKYTLLEMDQDETEEEVAETEKKLAQLDEIDGVKVTKKVAACQLDKPTQNLVQLIFDNDMFKEQMQNFELDVKKMPLGKLSKTQIAKGFEALEDIEKAITESRTRELQQLTSRFYTLIPHSFGRKIPPVINDPEMVQKKKDMLLVLADIELAQSLQKDKDKAKAAVTTTEVPHPLDVNYGLLMCGLTHVKPASDDYKVIQKYMDATKGWCSGLKILDVWKVDRDGEDDRFSAHKDISNRRLLWHGTNVAVVAAILKSGLRIMPHSGGRVGRGIYFASENGKSAGYVGRTGKNIGIMFLNEVALGKEHEIKRDNGSLVKAPPGYDSIIARGRQEPDPSKDTTIEIDGNKVTVPQGKPVNQPKWKDSYFSQSEYLVYKESQNRIRYLLKLQF